MAVAATDLPLPVCTVKVPQTTPWVQLDFGYVSILFSFGRPAGMANKGEVFVLAANKATRKHLNRWRDFRVQKEVPIEEFNRILLAALHREARIIENTLNIGRVEK